MATTKTMTRVGVLSVGKVVGVMYTFIGLVAGGIMGFMNLFLSSKMVYFGAESSVLSSLSRGILPLLCFPIMYGILGETIQPLAGGGARAGYCSPWARVYG